jgi:dTDP-4-amino-4,6-dideoxygalactose transaminase
MPRVNPHLHVGRLPVTRPDLPPLDQLIPLLGRIWDTRIVTNCGEFHVEFERQLASYLGVEHVSLFANATLALMTAFKALRVSGDVITTPYSFVATGHSLLWNDINPVFADIDRRTLNLCPVKAEELINEKTTAILPVHVYGVPCDVDAFKRMAEKYNLKLIYDAAHAFGVQRVGAGAPHSILSYGDLSVVSFHGTKVFNTFEGGAIVSSTKELKIHIDHLKNYGFVDETTIVATGMNAKMSEFNAALGLLQLERVDLCISERAHVDRQYRDLLSNINGIRIHEPSPSSTANYGYFPIFIEPEFPVSRDEVHFALRERGILSRRYFYPLISQFPMYRNLPSAAPGQLPIAQAASSRVICLPIYPGIKECEVGVVVDTIVELAGGNNSLRRARPLESVNVLGA